MESESTAPYDETCPLLYEQRTLEAQKPGRAKYTPLPKAQLAALCGVRLVDPIAFTQIFPYINQFMSDLHVTNDPSRIGFYSGLVESVFAISQLCSIYQWARISDNIGRRPVVLMGIVGIAITTLLFGLSRSLFTVLLARSIGGLFSGNVAVIHSVLGELTDSTNQAVAYPIYGLIWPLGSIIGPLLGGTFSNPATKYPNYYSHPFFQTYPYFMPCFVAAVIALLGALFGYYALDETLPSKRRDRSEKGVSASYVAVDDHDHVPHPVESTSFRSLLSNPAIYSLSASGFCLSFIATAFDVVFVLFCYSPVLEGGLAFSTTEIGYSLAISGGISACMQLFFMPYLLRTFDPAKMYNFCMSLWPCTFMSMPLLNVLAVRGYDIETGSINPHALALLWLGIAVVLAISRTGALAYSLSMILIKENAPSPSSLGASNGLVQFAMCFSRAFSPAFVSSCFAYSLENKILGGHAWIVVMVVICLFGSSVSRKLNRK